jgi:adenine phosphoribosyltransferase
MQARQGAAINTGRVQPSIEVDMDALKKLIREVPDFPKKGILFYDITTLLKDKSGFRGVIDTLTNKIRPYGADLVLGIEARGFIFAPALAYHLGAGFVPVRKPKKLPAETERISYELEYGMDTLEIHKDAVTPGMRVVVADDLLATGGTALATIRLVEKLGGTVVAVSFVIELDALKGRDRLQGYEVVSLLQY